MQQAPLVQRPQAETLPECVRGREGGEEANGAGRCGPIGAPMLGARWAPRSHMTRLGCSRCLGGCVRIRAGPVPEPRDEGGGLRRVQG